MDFQDCRAYVMDSLARAEEEMQEIRDGLEKLKTDDTVIPITGKTKRGELFTATFTLKEPKGDPASIELKIEKVYRYQITKPPGD